MDARTTTTSDRAATRRAAKHRTPRRPPSVAGRPGLFLGVAAAGAVLVNALIGTGPAAQAEAGASESVSVARQLGLSASSGPVDAAADLEPLEDLVASRSTREAEQTAAQRAQAAADEAERNRLAAEAEAKAAAEAAAASAAEAAAQEQAAASAAPSPAAASISATTVAHISNSYGDVKPQVQAAADAVVSNVPGAAGITLGGTRASATDPHGHPSGLALDYMCLSDTSLGNAIVAYHIAHWDELGVEYLIYRQRMLSSPGGSWESMSDRGSSTANHMDHVHVNYLG